MKKYIGLLFLSLLFMGGVFGQNLPEKPNPMKLVNDYINILAPDQVQTLERKLVEYDKKTSNQIVVLCVDDIGGLDINDFGTEIIRKWGVGIKGKDNGVVLIMYRSKDGTKRKVAISTGYGLESTLSDYVSKTIIDNDIIPLFKNQDFYGGLNNGTTSIIQVTDGTYKGKENYYNNEETIPGWLIMLVFFAIILFIIWASKNKNNGGGGYMSRRGHTGWFGPTIFPSSGGGWFDGGGGGGGGFGGFGGFGGGSGGGGGASGDW